jgi:hypothetical protein
VSAEPADTIRTAAATRSLDATARAGRALRELHHRGADVNFAAVAAIAGVSSQFLYTHPSCATRSNGSAASVPRLSRERRPQTPRATRRSARVFEQRSMTINDCARRTPGYETNSPSRTAARANSKPVIEPAGTHRRQPILRGCHRFAASEQPSIASKPCSNAAAGGAPIGTPGAVVGTAGRRSPARSAITRGARRCIQPMTSPPYAQMDETTRRAASERRWRERAAAAPRSDSRLVGRPGCRFRSIATVTPGSEEASAIPDSGSGPIVLSILRSSTLKRECPRFSQSRRGPRELRRLVAFRLLTTRSTAGRLV